MRPTMEERSNEIGFSCPSQDVRARDSRAHARAWRPATSNPEGGRQRFLTIRAAADDVQAGGDRHHCGIP